MREPKIGAKAYLVVAISRHTFRKGDGTPSSRFVPMLSSRPALAHGMTEFFVVYGLKRRSSSLRIDADVLAALLEGLELDDVILVGIRRAA